MEGFLIAIEHENKIKLVCENTYSLLSFYSKALVEEYFRNNICQKLPSIVWSKLNSKIITFSTSSDHLGLSNIIHHLGCNSVLECQLHYNEIMLCSEIRNPDYLKNLSIERLVPRKVIHCDLTPLKVIPSGGQLNFKRKY